MEEAGCHPTTDSATGFYSSPKEQENAKLDESKTEFSTSNEAEEAFFYSYLKLEHIPQIHQTRRFYEMGDEELLDWCDVGEEERQTVVTELDTLRTYMKQVEESEGFDIDVYPKNGLGIGIVDIAKTACSRELYPGHYEKLMNLAKLAITKFNMDNYPVEYEVLHVEKANMTTYVFDLYYITFTAYDVKACGEEPAAACRTFQAIVAVDWPEDELKKVYFCRLKGATS